MLNPSTFRITLKSMFFVFLFFFSFLLQWSYTATIILAKTTGHVTIIPITTRVNVDQVSWEKCVKVKFHDVFLTYETLYTYTRPGVTLYLFYGQLREILAILMCRLIYMYFSDRSLLRRAMPKQWILRQLWQSLPVHLSCSICWTKLWRWMSHRFPSSWLLKVTLHGTILNDEF